MNAFLLLFVAILCEIVGTTALKVSEGFTRVVPVLVIAVSYGLAFYLFSLSLREIPLGTAYAIWSGVGTAGTVAIGVWLWQEGLDAPRIIGIMLIIIGVVVLQLFSKQSTA